MTSITKKAYLDAALHYADTNYREGSNNHNRFGEELNRDNEYWCADFECGVARELDSAHWEDLIPNTPGCLSAIAEWRKRGQFCQGYNGIMSGDIAYLGLYGEEHTFIVVSLSGLRVNTVEGNTNNDGSSNGNGVYRRNRPINSIYGYGRPRYAPPVTMYRPLPGEDWNDVAKKYRTDLVNLRHLNGGNLVALSTKRDIRVN